MSITNDINLTTIHIKNLTCDQLHITNNLTAPISLSSVTSSVTEVGKQSFSYLITDNDQEIILPKLEPNETQYITLIPSIKMKTIPQNNDINGSLVIGDYIYICGDITSLSDGTPVYGLMRFNKTTLIEDRTWIPKFPAEGKFDRVTVYSIVQHGNDLFVGSDHVDDIQVWKVSMEDAQVTPVLYSDTDRTRVLLIDGNYLYVGGGFTGYYEPSTYDFIDQACLLRISLDDLQVDTNWTPRANDTIYHMFLFDNYLYISGQFTEVNYTSCESFVRISTITGELSDWVSPFSPYQLDPIFTVVYKNHCYICNFGDVIVDDLTYSRLARLTLVEGEDPTLDSTWRPLFINDYSSFVRTIFIDSKRDFLYAVGEYLVYDSKFTGASVFKFNIAEEREELLNTNLKHWDYETWSHVVTLDTSPIVFIDNNFLERGVMRILDNIIVKSQDSQPIRSNYSDPLKYPLQFDFCDYVFMGVNQTWNVIKISNYNFYYY
jgi:hypothetical protein